MSQRMSSMSSSPIESRIMSWREAVLPLLFFGHLLASRAGWVDHETLCVSQINPCPLSHIALERLGILFSLP
jgi:hypothetical protein